MRVVGADEEQHDGHAQQELLGRGVLVTVVNLLPHVQVVVCARVELEGHAAHPVEHEVAAEHVGYVGERPRRLLRHAGDDVVEDLEANDEDEVDGPGACGPLAGGSTRAHSESVPLALTHCELRLGRAAWSLMCSRDSGGSVYIRLDERRRRPAFSELILSAWAVVKWPGCGSTWKEVVRLRSMGDSLAVLEATLRQRA